MKTIWRNGTSRILSDDQKGLFYEYVATRTEQNPICRFSLFSEVGRPYQHAFLEFFEKNEVEAGAVEYANHPWYADKWIRAKS
jgi:hypothetical protein